MLHTPQHVELELQDDPLAPHFEPPLLPPLPPVGGAFQRSPLHDVACCSDAPQPRIWVADGMVGHALTFVPCMCSTWTAVFREQRNGQ